MTQGMEIGERRVLDTRTLPWQETPGATYSEKVLEDGEGGRAKRRTSILRLGPEGVFPKTDFSSGAEIYVLEGLLRCGDVRLPEGSYVTLLTTAPVTFSSDAGCTLFLKTGHLEKGDPPEAIVSTRDAPWFPGLVEGLSVMPLFRSGTRNTALVRWAPGTHFQSHRHYGGEEILVLEGVFEDEHGRYGPGTWMRSPHLSQHRPFSQEGCLIFVKTGHLSSGINP
ncbi:cupin domain-containing protein [Leptospirillum ferriphilum]|uniref:Cupin n=1 Tax=Leptospirillum ferriphilum YSK TaxID=1441628 RepID=A0A059XMT1_9BACT|nr:cupin domain-containing protein [Leptospirillum ferriphilum]AIA29819.1 cupin [Leptospirillum ferriphilum YSK]